MDLANTIEPDSTQINAEDFLSGPRTFTIAEVSKGTAEQPVNIALVELPGRAYRPSKTMRRVLVSVWGAEASAYAGRRLTLYRDPEVAFGRDKVGGIKISQMSNLDKRVSLMLTASRGKRAAHVVEPLTEAAPDPSPRGLEPSATEVAASSSVDELGAMWKLSGPELRAQIESRVFELKESQLPQSGADVDPNGAIA